MATPIVSASDFPEPKEGRPLLEATLPRYPHPEALALALAAISSLLQIPATYPHNILALNALITLQKLPENIVPPAGSRVRISLVGARFTTSEWYISSLLQRLSIYANLYNLHLKTPPYAFKFLLENHTQHLILERAWSALFHAFMPSEVILISGRYYESSNS
jgi:hypothetical protein